jgi:hypothetical protein
MQALIEREADSMTPTTRNEGNLERIFTALGDIQRKVDQSLEQGRDNGSDLKLLRKELGMDGQHGRIPSLESNVVRLELLIVAQEKRVDALEILDHLAQGKKQLVTVGVSVISSAGAVALLGWLAKVMGFLH